MRWSVKCSSVIRLPVGNLPLLAAAVLATSSLAVAEPLPTALVRRSLVFPEGMASATIGGSFDSPPDTENQRFGSISGSHTPIDRLYVGPPGDAPCPGAGLRRRLAARVPVEAAAMVEGVENAVRAQLADLRGLLAADPAATRDLYRGLFGEAGLTFHPDTSRRPARWLVRGALHLSKRLATLEGFEPSLPT
jgi:hypothetical protein